MLTSTAGNTSFVGTAIQPAIEGLTVVRIRGRLSGFLEVAAAAGAGFQGAFGIGIATLAAVTAGIASVPTPITERDAENWLYWTPISTHGGDATAGSRNWQNGAFDYEVDTKAMRKFPSEMAIYAAIEMVIDGTATLSIFFDSRSLIMLP